MSNKIIIIAASVLIFGGLLVWLFMESSKPLPGEKQADLDREHIEVGKEAQYNSNPPTSGPHYEEWIKAGVYETPKDDRNLVHSLEHGYVIMSYNCDLKLSTFNFQLSTVYAHGIEEATSGAEASDSATLTEAFRSEDCHTLVDQLISIYEKKGKHKLIVVPRPNLDAKIALTAWTYLDKFNGFDEDRILKFIDTHKDNGPEKTIEPAGE